MSAHPACRFLSALTVPVLVLSVTTFALSITGCTGGAVDSPKSLSSQATLDAIDQSAPAATPVVDPNGPGLADLAQRDVDDFLRLQHEATEKANEPAPASETPATSLAQTDATAEVKPPTPTPPAIIWTDPVGKAIAERAAKPVDFTDPKEIDKVTMGDKESANNDSPNGVLAIPEVTPTEGAATNDRMNELLVGLSSELYMRASDADQPLRELIMITATSMVDPTRKLANIDALPGLTDREREMLTAFQDFFLKLGEQLDGSTEADSAIVSALQDLQTSLVKAPTLTIPASALCTTVEGFGKYVPFAQNHFLAHSGQQMVVYVEIGDFTCTQNKVGQWVTELAQQLVIYSDRDGIPVWREEWLPVVDTASKARQDFYTTQLITIPDALSVGKYQLKIRLRDEHSGAEAEHSIEFEMVADPKLAVH